MSPYRYVLYVLFEALPEERSKREKVQVFRERVLEVLRAQGTLLLPDIPEVSPPLELFNRIVQVHQWISRRLGP